MRQLCFPTKDGSISEILIYFVGSYIILYLLQEFSFILTKKYGLETASPSKKESIPFMIVECCGRRHL